MTLTEFLASNTMQVIPPGTPLPSAAVSLGNAELYYVGNNLSPYVLAEIGSPDPEIPGT